MTRSTVRSVLAALLCAALACASHASPAAGACAATARRTSTDARIPRAIAEARRQHLLFGGQTIERDGGLFRIGHHEAEWDLSPGETTGTWQRVAAFWSALAPDEPPRVRTSRGWIERSQAAPDAAANAGEATKAQVAVREALLRAAIVDTPWSAAFISYVMRAAGFARDEFAFSDSHAVYVRAALEASAAEAAGRDTAYAFRACELATTPPRAGDLLCATRASTIGIATFDALAAALADPGSVYAFPMHCELVVRSDEGGDGKLESIGGNVVQSVTLSRMTLNARKVLGAGYIGDRPPPATCGRATPPCAGHLSRRPWVVLLQARH